MSPTEFLYTLEHGSYYWRVNGQIVSMSDEIAIMFDKNDWTLLKHGSPELVEKRFDKTQKAYRESGHDDIADDIVMVVGKFPVDDLNAMIGNNHHLKVMAEKYQWEDSDGKLFVC